MKYSTAEIASMTIDPVAGPAFVARKVADEWEPIDPKISLVDCLDAIVDEYARSIDNEIGWDKQRKLGCVEGLIATKLRRKQTDSAGSQSLTGSA